MRINKNGYVIHLKFGYSKLSFHSFNYSKSKNEHSHHDSPAMRRPVLLVLAAWTSASLEVLTGSSL